MKRKVRVAVWLLVLILIWNVPSAGVLAILVILLMRPLTMIMRRLVLCRLVIRLKMRLLKLLVLAAKIR